MEGNVGASNGHEQGQTLSVDEESSLLEAAGERVITLITLQRVHENLFVGALIGPLRTKYTFLEFELLLQFK